MTTTGGPPNVFSIPSGEPFLISLVRAIMRGVLPREGTSPPDPVGLSDYRILLPTRRAVRALADAFLEISDGVQLLPRMTPLGDVDEDELLFAAEAGSGEHELAAPPAISQLERRLILTRLILAWVGNDRKGAKPSVHTPAQAALLAGDLGRLIDMFDTEQADWDGLTELVEKELSSHWEDVLAFLELLRKTLPELLEARGQINPMARRNLLLEAQAARLQSDPGDAPVIAAGSTGSIPATAHLLRVVAGLPNGALVLPGLDMHLEDAAWESIGPEHPQYGLKQLLQRIGITRGDVRLLSAGPKPPRVEARARLLSEVMRPADATERWSTAIPGLETAHGEGAFGGFKRVTAPSQRDEALAIALIMRETLEDDRRTAALVTPDRRLARRVAAELARWDIAVDDSAGEPLSSSTHGTFIQFLVDTVASDCAAVPLLALLKHPLAACGRQRQEVRRLAGLIEISALRGLSPRGGLDGVRRAVERCRDAQAAGTTHLDRSVAHVTPQDWSTVNSFLKDFGGFLEPLAALFRSGAPAPAGRFLRAHVASAEAVARPAGAQDDKSPLWQGDAGEALAEFFSALLEAETLAPALAPADYASFAATLMAGHVVRPRFGRHPRLHIWGLLEARLMQADRVILGGLTEGSWPPHAITDVWLNRPMRAGLDLEPPERRIGLTAHDFVQSASAREVYLTYAEKIDGTPTVPSRWLLRLEALLKEVSAKDDITDQRWIRWALGKDNAKVYAPISAPRPRPPVEARPRRMSVTQVENWIRDPYAVFAREILKLEPLPPLAGDPTAADRGSIIHEVLHRASRSGGDISVERLLQVGADVFREYIDFADVAAFWWPRFERVARWLVEERVLGGEDVGQAFAEVSGSLDLAAPAGTFTLRARADRIDVLNTGSAVIVDYKTGQLPSGKQVASGLSPQLPLEAAMAAAGAFGNVGARKVERLQYVRISGGEPPGQLREIKAKSPEQLSAEAMDGLASRIAAFDRVETPYLPRTIVESERQERDYDHLSRHREWARQAGDGDGA